MVSAILSVPATRKRNFVQISPSVRAQAGFQSGHFRHLVRSITYSLIDKQGMTAFHAHSEKAAIWNAMTYYLAEGCIALVLYNAYILLQFRWRQVAEIGRREWKQVITAATLAMVSYTLILYLLMTEKVSYIVALRQCSVIFAVLLGSYKLHESGLRLRLAGAALMVFGMFLIAMAE